MPAPTQPASVARSRLADVWQLALVALVYAFTLKLTLFIPDAKGVITGLWPPGGVALATLLLNPPRRWASILAVIFVTGLGVDLVSGRPGLPCVGFMLANVLESWGCAWVLTRICGDRRVTFETVDSVVALGVGAIAVNGLTALLGASSARLVSHASFLENYLDWWISDGLGILLVTPLVVVCIQSWRLVFIRGWLRRAEVAALILVWCALAGLAFLGVNTGLPVTPRPYWILIPLVWSALRFGIKVTIVLLALLALIAVSITTSGRGDYSLGGGNLLEHLRMVQFFLGVLVLSGLTLASVVAERKQAEEEIKRLAADLHLILATIPLGVAFLKDRRVKTTNIAHDRFFGYDHDEIVGSETRMLYARPEEYVRVGLEGYAAMARGEVFRTESEMRRKDGSTFTCHLAGQAIIAQDLTAGSIWLVEDITERKRAESEQQRLEAVNQQLQKSESLGRMAGAIAHNFNNQLQSVTLGLEMAIGEQSMHGAPDDNLVEALRSARKAADISSQMLLYLGQTSVKSEPLDLAGLLRRSLPMLTAAMPKTLLLQTALPDPGPVILANADQLRQVLTILLTNAWEASSTPSGTIRLTVKPVPAGEIPAVNRFPVNWQPQVPAYGCFEVADSGCGIAAGDLDKLFDPFFSTKFAGRGLGLSVALGIVTKYGGTFTVESEPGQGSVFRVFLPVTASAVSPPRALAAPVARAPGCGAVLVVEDDVSLCNFAKVALRRNGFTVLTAGDGVEALEVFQQHQDEIGCVVCDLTMPRMGGWETVAALRKLAPGLRVILASGHNECKVMDGEHAELPQAFLHKPYEMKELISAINQA